MESQGEGAPSGWPLGLPPVTFRMRLADVLSTAHPSSIVTATPSFSSLSSSDLDTESSFSFFSERSITHGSFIGSGRAVPSLRSRSVSPSNREPPRLDSQSRRTTNESRTLWSLIRCSSCRKDSDACTPSLAHMLRNERQVAASRRAEKLYFNMVYEETARFAPEANSDFAPSSAMGSKMCSPSSLPIIVEEGSDGSSLWAIRTSNDGGIQRVGGAGLQRKHRRTKSEGSGVLSCASHPLEPPNSSSVASETSSAEKLEITNCRTEAVHRRANTQILETSRKEHIRDGLSNRGKVALRSRDTRQNQTAQL